MWRSLSHFIYKHFSVERAITLLPTHTHTEPHIVTHVHLNVLQKRLLQKCAVNSTAHNGDDSYKQHRQYMNSKVV